MRYTAKELRDKRARELLRCAGEFSSRKLVRNRECHAYSCLADCSTVGESKAYPGVWSVWCSVLPSGLVEYRGKTFLTSALVPDGALPALLVARRAKFGLVPCELIEEIPGEWSERCFLRLTEDESLELLRIVDAALTKPA